MRIAHEMNEPQQFILFWVRFQRIQFHSCKTKWNCEQANALCSADSALFMFVMQVRRQRSKSANTHSTQAKQITKSLIIRITIFKKRIPSVEDMFLPSKIQFLVSGIVFFFSVASLILFFLHRMWTTHSERRKIEWIRESPRTQTLEREESKSHKIILTIPICHFVCSMEPRMRIHCIWKFLRIYDRQGEWMNPMIVLNSPLAMRFTQLWRAIFGVRRSEALTSATKFAIRVCLLKMSHFSRNKLSSFVSSSILRIARIERAPSRVKQ